MTGTCDITHVYKCGKEDLVWLLYDLLQGMLVVGSMTISGIISICKGWKRRDDQVQDLWDRRSACKGL